MRLIIAGEPVAQGRPKFRRTPKFVQTYDPKKSRTWKTTAREVMQARLGGTSALPFPEGPLSVHIVAVFTCPVGDYRKREPTPRRPHAKRPDAENVAKCVLDAATSILWRDDSQVARLTVEKVIAAQGEAPYVEVTVVNLGVPCDAPPEPDAD